MGQQYYNSFDEYVKDYPEAERYRNWITNIYPIKRKGIKSKKKIVLSHPTRNAIILKTTIEHPSLPGGYFWAYITNWKGKWWITVNDSDDFSVRSEDFENETDAQKVLESLKDLVPFDMVELQDFGFHQE